MPVLPTMRGHLTVEPGNILVGRPRPQSSPQHVYVDRVNKDGTIEWHDALGMGQPPFHAWGWATLQRASRGNLTWHPRRSALPPDDGLGAVLFQARRDRRGPRQTAEARAEQRAKVFATHQKHAGIRRGSHACPCCGSFRTITESTINKLTGRPERGVTACDDCGAC